MRGAAKTATDWLQGRSRSHWKTIYARERKGSAALCARQYSSRGAAQALCCSCGRMLPLQAEHTGDLLTWR